MKPIQPDPRIEQAALLHQSGKLVEATALVKELLRSFPKNPQLLTQLGTLYLQQGEFEESVRTFKKSLEITPQQPAALANGALAFEMLGRFRDAMSYVDRAIALKPDYAEAHNNRGVLLKRLDRLDEAVASYDRAIRFAPNYAQAYNNLGAVMQALGKTAEAAVSYNQALTIAPHYAEAHFNLGNVLKLLQRPDEALASYDRAVAIAPNYVEALNNQAVLFQELKQFDKALAGYDRVIFVRQGDEAAYNNRGNVLRLMGRLNEAKASYARAIALKPNYFEAHNNRAVVLQELYQFDEALSGYDRAIELDPNYAEAYWNKAQLLNLTGNFLEGWKLFEWRWKGVQKSQTRSFAQPLWLGHEPLGGKTILLHGEQGAGDMMQFCRYVPLVEAMGVKVVLEVPKQLMAIISTLPGHFTLVERGTSLPDFDLHCPLMSLPLAFQTIIETIPAPIPYLFAEPGKKKMWQEKLGVKTKPRVGLVWSGRTAHQNDRHRSLRLELLRPLLELPFEFHSLQKEYREGDSALLAELPQIQDHSTELDDFSDTAALISEMDLVLSVDTSVTHLAGALGKPLWVLLPYMPDYRWLLGRKDSPWYPTATLFRQSSFGDWGSVILELVKEIAQLR